MTHAVRDFDQLWSRPKGRLPDFRLCRKCRLCHPKHIRGCPTEDLRTEIETLRLVLKNKNATMQVREKFLEEVDEQVSEFLMCIECVRRANWTLFTDISSPAQYVMLNSTILCIFLCVR